MSHFKISLEDTFEIVGRQKLYDLPKCLAFLQERGTSIYGHHFFMSLHQREMFYKLIAYAIEDAKVMGELGLEPNKGLLLLGNTQTGKTAYFRLIQPFFSRRRNYIIKSSRLIAQEFATNGYAAFDSIFAPNAKVICLDHIGHEQIAKYYGSSCDVVLNIVTHFYEQRFDLTYPRLHITTTLSPTELEEKYGKSFRTMLQELTNVMVCE